MDIFVQQSGDVVGFQIKANAIGVGLFEIYRYMELIGHIAIFGFGVRGLAAEDDLYFRSDGPQLTRLKADALQPAEERLHIGISGDDGL